MQWIFDNFQVVAVVFLIAASLVKRFLEAKAEERQARERMDEPEEAGPFEPDEWRMPEAPAPSVPPPLERRTPPPVRQAAGPPPLRVDTADVELILKRQQEMEERLQQYKAARAATRANTTGGAAATNDRVIKRAAPAASAAGGLRSTLLSRSETRRSIVMREILGPPLGLR